jgi:protein-tyrosine phosphatase
VLDIMSANPDRAGQDPTTSFMRQLTAPGATAEAASALMADTMTAMALTAGPLYGRMMRRLIEVDAPLLFHCSAGKDRTGMSTALLMKVLGATDAAIQEDYLLVNTLLPAETWAPEMAKRLEQQTGVHVDAKLLQPLLGTRPEWLEGAFQGISRQYGSFDAYRERSLNLTADDVRRLCSRLVR